MKKYFLIALLLCINVQIHGERPCLWICLMQAGCLASTITGGLLGYYFPSPILGSGDNNATWVIGAIGGTTTYFAGLGIAAAIKTRNDGICCND